MGITALSEHMWDWLCIIRAEVGLTLHYHSPCGTDFALSEVWLTLHYHSTYGINSALSAQRWGWLCIIRAEVGLTALSGHRWDWLCIIIPGSSLLRSSSQVVDYIWYNIYTTISYAVHIAVIVSDILNMYLSKYFVTNLQTTENFWKFGEGWFLINKFFTV